MKIEYQCSNCGKREKTSAMVGIPHVWFLKLTEDFKKNVVDYLKNMGEVAE